MQRSDIPTKFSIPFANSAGAGFTRPIPQSPPGGGAASLTQGFPPETFVPVGSGGTPPDGRDMNGILNETSAWNRWQSAGGAVTYDAVFAAAVGGYFLGAVLASATIAGLQWVSVVDNNLIDPDAGATNSWVAAGSTPNTQVFTGSGAIVVLDNAQYIGLKLSGTATVTLPTTNRLGRKLIFQDLLYNMFTNKLVMSPGGGSNIGGRVGAFTMNQNGQTAELTWYGSNTWGLST